MGNVNEAAQYTVSTANRCVPSTCCGPGTVLGAAVQQGTKQDPALSWPAEGWPGTIHKVLWTWGGNEDRAGEGAETGEGCSFKYKGQVRPQSKGDIYPPGMSSRDKGQKVGGVQGGTEASLPQ